MGISVMVGGAALVGPCVVGRADVPDYDFNWAYVHNEGNAAIPSAGDNFGRGSVGYGYRISKLEITTQQWADFVNMALRQGVNVVNAPDLKPAFWGASLAGSQYAVTSPLQAVIGLNWRAGAYYCNWLNNGKQESWASCQSGAYDASTFGDLSDGRYSDQLYHSPGAKFWIPTLDEWLKAAHYDPNKDGQGQGGWWDYCYGSDVAPVPGAPAVGQTSAGWHSGTSEEFRVPLGSYGASVSAYGLWDLSGGAEEWLEEPTGPWHGGFVGRRLDGSYAGATSGTVLDALQQSFADGPKNDTFYGFRIAGQVPSPPGAAVILVGFGGLVRPRRR